jgi:hypothetical protein
MNKIDAFFVAFSLLLVWYLGLYLIPNSVLALIYQLIASVAIGLWIGKLVLDLKYGSERKMVNELFGLLGTYSDLTGRVFEENEKLQAKIDALMLEYCPEEMTQEQLANWAAHQETIDPAIQKMINGSLH